MKLMDVINAIKAGDIGRDEAIDSMIEVREQLKKVAHKKCGRTECGFFNDVKTDSNCYALDVADEDNCSFFTENKNIISDVNVDIENYKIKTVNSSAHKEAM